MGLNRRLKLVLCIAGWVLPGIEKTHRISCRLDVGGGSDTIAVSAFCGRLSERSIETTTI